ncbi:MAG: hypothetical protein MUE42_01475 [Opitutaceae bacterium]|jgi:hypothetical protein|nr:hypothetical protein [Opitutaceae bacterium]
MAWRIDEYLIHGEIDNRTPGRVTGRLWFLGREQEPVTVELEGNAWRDVAGHVLRFTNPRPTAPVAGFLDRLASEQRGVVGDITASRKVRVPECSMEEVMRLVEAGKSYPWHWANCLYLEWHSERNGRVVIESVDYQVELDAEAAWVMSEEEEAAQQAANGSAMIAFMERLDSAAFAGAEIEEDLGAIGTKDEEDDEDAPTSAAEALADVEQARMELLLDRVQARLQRAREAGVTPDYETILREERARLGRELGKVEPAAADPEQEAEEAAWIEELNAAAEEALSDVAEEPWPDEVEEHPLVRRCIVLHKRIHDDCAARGWLSDVDSEEHPLRELDKGVLIAGGKLAGALNPACDGEAWPPEPLYAGDVLVRLKKARGHLRDALAGLDDASAQGLADAVWLAQAGSEVIQIRAEVDRLIGQVRAVLERGDIGPENGAEPTA